MHRSQSSGTEPTVSDRITATGVDLVLDAVERDRRTYRRCQNCSVIHSDGLTERYQDCFHLTVRRSGRNPSYLPIEGGYCQKLPRDRRSLEEIREKVWEGFESVKSENDHERRDLEEDKDEFKKGLLKTTAPIPWLRYVTPRGRKGQTRSQDNFRSIWEVVTNDEEFWAAKDMWFTTSLLPAGYNVSPASGEVELEDGDIIQRWLRRNVVSDSATVSADTSSRGRQRSSELQRSLHLPR